MGGNSRVVGQRQQKALLPRDVRTYGMDRTDESDDLVERGVRRKRKTIEKICRLSRAGIEEFDHYSAYMTLYSNEHFISCRIYNLQVL